MKKETYKVSVINVYGINGSTTHRTPEAALRACEKRTGEGWIVIDSDGYQWDYDFMGRPRIIN